MTALAATVGMGNIAGVGTAIAAGGPGALFWMWITGLFGMATKYSEALLGVATGWSMPNGRMAGGPMYYLSRGMGGPFGKALGFLFALFAAIAAFGIGNMVQSNSVRAMPSAFVRIPPTITGAVIGLAALVIFGGIQSIGRVDGLLRADHDRLLRRWAGSSYSGSTGAAGDIFIFVLKDAFTPRRAVGGFPGASA